MKRSGFKPRKSPLRAKTPLRASQRLRRVSKQPISKLQKLIWNECKRITRATYGNSCYTCPKKGLKGSDWHTGHMWPKAALGAYLKYDLRILRPQCYHCNINLGGCGADFIERMSKECAPEFMAALREDRKVTVKAYDHYLRILDEYRRL